MLQLSQSSPAASLTFIIVSHCVRQCQLLEATLTPQQVLHAIIALSALYENLEYYSGSALAMERKRVFLQQYNKSIGYLRARQNQEIHDAELLNHIHMPGDG